MMSGGESFIDFDFLKAAAAGFGGSVSNVSFFRLVHAYRIAYYQIALGWSMLDLGLAKKAHGGRLEAVAS